MIRTTALSLALLPAAAMAHPGHLAPVAGHDHWWVLPAAAALAVVAAAVVESVRARRRK